MMTQKTYENRRHFEDLALGEVIHLGQIKVTKEMIFSFATEFDPLPFHLDEKAANASLLGGLSASGWQTASLCQKMLVDSFLGKVASMGGLGYSHLKWVKPVMVDDTISGTATLSSLRQSASNKNWGIVAIDLDIRNQRNQQVMVTQLSNLIGIRNPDAFVQQHAAVTGELV